MRTARCTGLSVVRCWLATAVVVLCVVFVMLLRLIMALSGIRVVATGGVVVDPKLERRIWWGCVGCVIRWPPPFAGFIGRVVTYFSFCHL